MWAQFDTLRAALVGSVVLMVLLSLSSWKARFRIDELASLYTKRQAEVLARWLEEDMRDVGRGIPPGENPIKNIVYTGNGQIGQFEYEMLRYDPDIEDTVRIRVRYFTRPRNNRGVLELERQEKPEGASGWTVMDVAPGLISNLRFDFLDEDNNPIDPRGNNYDRVRLIRVSFSVVPPFEILSQRGLTAYHYTAAVFFRRSDGGLFPVQ